MTQAHFEMLWDCPQCATRGLLAKSQQYCPACGAAQDATRRYFPEPGTEVEVQGHTFVGRDWICPFCQSPNGAQAAFCTHCGASREGSQPVPLVKDIPTAPPPEKKTSKPNQKWGLGKALGALVLFVLGLLGYQFSSTHEEQVTVTTREWVREVDVEHLARVSESAWCDALPADAYQVSRTREQRGTRKVEQGQDCVEQRVDMGDGTFTKQQECTPRYHEEPVYDLKCHYQADRWQVARTERTQGNGSVLPAWPTPSLTQAVAEGALGQERTGPRREQYQIHMLGQSGKKYTCPVNAEVWRQTEERQTLNLQVRKLGGPVCDLLGKTKG